MNVKGKDHVCIVVLNWNRLDDTIECLISLQRLRVINYQLTTIVVDNNSSDNSPEGIETFLRTHKKLNGVFIRNDKNLGFSGGNNVGIKYAIEHGADYVLVLNNDTEVADDVIEQFVEFAHQYENAGILSPKIYFSKGYEFHKDWYRENELGKVIWYVGGMMDWKNVMGSNYGVDDVDVGQYQTKREIDFATGACMFINKKVIEQIGYFDEKYFLYLEDADYSLRAKLKGWEIAFVPNARVWHKVSQSSGIGSDLNDYYITRNRLLFGLRYAPIRAKVALVRESLRLFAGGRVWQKKGVVDFYKGNFGKGSFTP